MRREFMFRQKPLILALAILTVAAGGCSSAGTDTAALSQSSGQSSGLTLPSLSALAPSSVTPPAAIETPVGSATEIYSRVAQGAVGCWFGTKGPLKKDFIYHAEADAPSRGGKAEIVVHVRDVTQPNPRGAKAYRVKITPTSETSAALATENLKMPEIMAAAMTEDVNRWSKGDQGCVGTSTTAGWNAPAESPPGAPTAPSPKKKLSKKATAAAKQATGH